MERAHGYQLQSELGRGASARVFRGVRETDGEICALKVFHPQFWGSEDARFRAQREALLGLELQHPNIVRVRETFLDLDPPTVVMDLVDGESLDQFQTRVPYVFPELSLFLILDLLRALEYLHSKGTVHRDLKPANLLVDRRGQLRVTDFGLARLTDLSRNTMTGSILGSPEFMSPEQARGETVDARSDLFSVGVILYFLVTGTKPFSRSNPLATLAAVCQTEAEPPQKRNPKVSARLALLILKALEKNPTRRFASATEFREAIEGYLARLGLLETLRMEEFVRDPSGTVYQGLQRVAETLGRQVEQDLEKADIERALSDLNHLGAVAPESLQFERLLAQLRQAQDRKRRRPWLWSVAVFLLLFAGVGAFLLARAPDSPLVESKTAAAPVPAREEAPPARVRAERPRLASASTAKEVRFRIPPGIRVYWEGREIDPTQPLSGVKVGTYRLKLEKEGFAPIEQRITVSANEPTVINVQGN